MASARLHHDYHTVSHINESHMSIKVERVSYCFTTRQTGGRMCVLGKFEHSLRLETITVLGCLCTTSIHNSREINKSAHGL